MDDNDIKKRNDIIDKIQLIKEIMKRFDNYFLNGFTNEIFLKLNEY